MAEAIILAGLGWVASSVISKLVNDSISYLGSNIGKDLEELENTLLPEFQLTIEAAQNSHPDDKDRLAKWLVRLKNAYFDAEAILHNLEYDRLKRKAKGEDKKLLVRFSSKPIIKPLVEKAYLLSPQKRELLQRLNKLKLVAAEAKNFRDLLGIHNTGSKCPDITSSFLTDKVAEEVQAFGYLSGIQKNEKKDGIIAGNNHSIASILANDLVKKSISYLGTDIVKDLENLETTLLPQFNLTIQAAKHMPPCDVAPLASWLAPLKSACNDAEAILHEVKCKARGEATRLSTCVLVKKSSQKKNLVQRLNKLKQVAVEAKTYRDLLGIGDNSPSITSPFFTDKIFGRDGDRDDIINFLLDDKDCSSLRKNYSVVAITGMGGVGKTTLAQYVYNDPKVKDYFNLRMWLCLSRNFDIHKVTKEMIECASKKECPNIQSLGFLQHMLTEILPKSSNIMVVLDDVWYDNYIRDVGEQQWRNLLAPFASRGGTCKIVVTSRSTSFPMALLPEKLIKLSNLSPDDFKSLLRYCVIDSLQISNPLLMKDSSELSDRIEIVDKIAEKMRKQPLAAKVVGNELCARQDIKFWRETQRKFNLSAYGVVVGHRNFSTSSLVIDKVFGRDGDCDEIINFATSPLLTSKVFGRDGVRDEIISFLLNKQEGSTLRMSHTVVAITGMGGVGKTTLAQYVYNDERIKKHFGVRMWLCLSQNFDINEVMKEMIEWTSGKECPSLQNFTELQDKLIETLSESDNIMVVLDGVWYDNYDRDTREQQWGNLLAPFGSRGGTCKIVVTSRSTSFPMAINPDKLIKLGDLAPGEIMEYTVVQKSKMSKQPLAAKVVGNHSITSSLVTNKTFYLDGDCDEIVHFATSPVLIGKKIHRDKERDEIINFLLDKQGGSSLRESYSVVVIAGEAGAGKTTLAHYLYNDERVKQHFSIRMWLCLSENFDINKVTKEMIEYASGKECPNLPSLNKLQNKLIETLPDSDNIMIVLDDVLYDRGEGENQWKYLLKPFASRGGRCKIVVTSRSSRLFPDALQPGKLIELHDLALDDFISLLRYHAFDGLQIKNPQLMNDLSDIVNHIAKKMSKSPLAAKVVGNQLCKLPEIGFWLATLHNVNLSDIMEILQWSFHRFDVQLQRCFLFCGVFPQGTRYSLYQLVHYWVALGLIQPTDDNENVEDVGLKYFEKLEANSVFYRVDERYIMHELFHRLAQELSAKDCFRVTSAEKKGPSSSVQHVYLQVDNEKLKENLSSICNLSNLHTLILGNPFIDDISEIISKKSTDFRNLRVLHVESRGYKTLPRGVGDFKNIQLLNFAKSSIEELPDSLLQLYHLQFLLLPLSVKTLPTKLSNLIKLRCIEMYNDDGHQVNTLPPVPYLGKLTSLQCLDEFHVKEKEGYELQQLGCLKEIGGSLRIVDLQNVRDKDKAVKARLIDKPKLIKLELVWVAPVENNGLEIEVIEALHPPAKLESLRIDGYMGSTYPTWLQEGSLVENLKDVRFYNCNALTILPANVHQFRDCSELILQNLGALKELPDFPENLARLSIIKCPCLVFVCENELQVSENQSIMKSIFLHGVEGSKDIFDHELKSFKQTGSVENCEGWLEVIESFVQGKEQRLPVNVNYAWWYCHQQRMNFIFRCNTRENKLKLPFMLRILNLSYCCVSDGALANCLEGMTKLEELYLEGIMTITTLPPEEISESLCSLRVLGITHCWYLRSLGGLHALPHLQRFRVQSCWCLEMNSIALNDFSTLEFIDIIDCPSISIKSFGNLQGRAVIRTAKFIYITQNLLMNDSQIERYNLMLGKKGSSRSVHEITTKAYKKARAALGYKPSSELAKKINKKLEEEKTKMQEEARKASAKLRFASL